MNDNKITIFTPTYNRAYTLPKCYKSLCSQTNNEFVWLIVDDGSTDGTEELVNEWKKEERVDIVYIKQKNKGKSLAHNTGVLACKTEIFLCVDSDDFLTDDAIQKIYNNWPEVSSNKNLAGFIALNGYSKDTPLSSEMPLSTKITSIFDLYDKYEFKGDTVIVFKTKVLRMFLFPSIPKEKFITEAFIYDQISQKYKMKLVNEILCICEYLPDGYSKNLLQIHKSSPKGYVLYLTQRVHFAKTFLEKKNAYSYYIAGCWKIAQKPQIINHTSKISYFVAFPKAVKIFVKSYLKSLLNDMRVFK